MRRFRAYSFCAPYGPARKKILFGSPSEELRSGETQQTLFPDPEDEKQKRLDKVFDEIRDKYGNDAMKRVL